MSNHKEAKLLQAMSHAGSLQEKQQLMAMLEEHRKEQRDILASQIPGGPHQHNAV